MTRIQSCAWVFLLSLLALPGCAGAPRGEAFQPEIVEPSRAIIYIYREPRLIGNRPVSVFVNQQAAGQLRPGQYMARVLPPGTYLVRAEASTSAVREIRLVPGDAAYLQITGAAKPQIQLPDSGVARDRIAKTTRAE